MTKHLVTIGLLCFNAEDTVERAVRSCLAQDWPDLEILIVDDASSDNTAELIQNLTKDEDCVRFLQHEQNTGPAGARNTVWREANGEFVVYFDDDDESYPHRVTEQLKTLTAYEQQTGARLVSCYAAGIRRYPNGYVKPLPAIGTSKDGVPKGSGFVDWLLFFKRNPKWDYGSGTPTCALMARRSTFTAVGGFDETLKRVEDGDFAIRLAFKGGHFIGTSQRLFTQYSTNSADKSPKINLQAEQRLVEKYADYLRSVNRYYYARHWPKLRYWHFKRRYDMLLLNLLGLLLVNPIAVSRHLLSTAPKRIVHERKMQQRHQQ